MKKFKVTVMDQEILYPGSVIGSHIIGVTPNYDLKNKIITDDERKKIILDCLAQEWKSNSQMVRETFSDDKKKYYEVVLNSCFKYSFGRDDIIPYIFTDIELEQELKVREEKAEELDAKRLGIDIDEDPFWNLTLDDKEMPELAKVEKWKSEMYDKITEQEKSYWNSVLAEMF